MHIDGMSKNMQTSQTGKTGYYGRTVAFQMVIAAVCALTLAATLPVQAQQLRNSRQMQPSVQPDASVRRTADYIVAIVGGEPITNNEVRARLFRLEMQLLNLGAETPPRSEMLPEVLERLISERAQVQRARELGVQVDEGSVMQAVANITGSETGGEQVAERLRKEGVSDSQLHALLRDELILARLRELKISQVSVSQAELDAYIEEQERATGLMGPELVNIGQLLIAVPENADPAAKTAAREKAEAIRQAVSEGVGLEKIGQEYDLPTGSARGMGERPLRDYPELFATAVARLPIGSVPPVLESGAGFHVLKVLQRRQASAGGANLVRTAVQTRAQHILLKPDEKLTEKQAIARLAQLREDIVSGKTTFAAAAREVSQDGSAVNGGDLGWSSARDFVPEFEMEMNLLAPEQISQPFISRFGVHLLKVNDRRVKQLDALERRSILVDALKEKKGQEELIKWARDVRARAYVEKRSEPKL